MAAMAFDIDAYTADAERFVSALDREYYLHFAGLKETFEIEAIYERHAGLFEKESVARLRELHASAPRGDEERRSRYLLQLAVEGFIGEATKAQAAELAEREAALEIEFDSERQPYRQASIVQAGEPEPERRAAIEHARNAALEKSLNPLHREAIERAHALSLELGWRSYREMYAELKGLDLEKLAAETRSFSDATEDRYREVVEPQLRAQTGLGFDVARRSDLPYFFRAKSYDAIFPAERLIETFERTLAGLG